MDLLVLNEDFQTLGIVDVFSSLAWNRKYYQTGDYELHAPAEYFELLQSGYYLHRMDVGETAKIETIYYAMDDSGGREVSVKGRFLEQLLADRIIDSRQELSGTGEEVIRELVQKFAVVPELSARKIAKLNLGEVSNTGIPTTIQLFGENLLEKLWEIAAAQELSLSLVYDYPTDKLLFTVRQGLDRTYKQQQNQWAVFSSGYENVLSIAFTDSKGDYKNFAYVTGEEENGKMEMLTIDRSEGEIRKELYVDAGDLRQTREDGSRISMEEYRKMLMQRGTEVLTEYKRNLLLEGDIAVNANLIYRKDFDLGDLCVYVDEDLGLEAFQRLSEISEVYENGNIQVTASFGAQGLGIMQKIKRRGR